MSELPQLEPQLEGLGEVVPAALLGALVDAKCELAGTPAGMRTRMRGTRK